MIKGRLGAGSVSHGIDYTTLSALHAENKDLPTVQLKRELWARLLRSALGAQFEDTDELFIEHTFLVNTAGIIAHSVLGYDVRQIPPATLVLGQLFEQAGIHGVVIDHKLYWGTVGSREEGVYLCAILNAPALTEIVRPLMSYGKDERDIDKAVWQLPIPTFGQANPGHQRLAEPGAAEASRSAALELDETKNFVKLRQTVRSVIAMSPGAEELDELVRLLLE
ncbi:hypothetical protein ACFW7K_01685 [Streptomyces sp. NPDC058735]|uniref:hypothetical protein n=1 Tax=Streptomyces sp. NPDC058735 TaxID=3346616 RepID=UPI0036812395